MGNLAKKIIDTAIAEIGTKENPSGSNKVKYNTDYYGREVSGAAYPWCAVFCFYVFNKAGLSNLFCGGTKTAYCPTVESYYKKHGQWFTSNPKVGDLVLFDFSRKGIASHIGILEKINAETASYFAGFSAHNMSGENQPKAHGKPKRTNTKQKKH